MKVRITIDDAKPLETEDTEWLGDYCGELINTAVLNNADINITIKQMEPKEAADD